MSPDPALSEHLAKLQRVYFHANFSRYFELTTQPLSGSQRLILKRTLTRKFQRCDLTWDLRQHSEDTCFAFTLHDQTHWLSFEALNLYYQLLPQYHHQYCRGLYEELLERLPKRSKRTIIEHTAPFLAPTALFGLHIERQEPRLKTRFLVTAKLSPEQSVKGITLDISPSGAQIWLPTFYGYRKGQTLSLTFEKYGDLSGEYQIIDAEVDGLDPHRRRVRLKRLLPSSETALPLSKLQHAMDHQDKCVAAETRNYEALFAHHHSWLVLQIQNGVLKHHFVNETPHSHWQWWEDEHRQSALHALFKTPHGKRVLTQQSVQGQLAAFRFHHQGKTHFYSYIADPTSPNDWQAFCRLGQTHGTLRVFQFYQTPLSENRRQWVLSLLSVSTDLRDSARDFQQDITAYHHSKSSLYQSTAIYFPDKPQRQTPRFLQQWQCQVRTENTVVEAYTLNIAKGGIKLGFQETASFKQETLLTVQFTRSIQLMGKVVRFDPQTQHANVQFLFEDDTQSAQWQSLINAHTEKKNTLEETKASPQAQAAIRHDLCRHLPTPCFFLEQTPKGIRLQRVGMRELPDALAFLRKENDTVDLTPLFKGKLQWLQNQTRGFLSSEKNHCDCLIRQDAQGEWHVEDVNEWGETLSRRLKFETAWVIRLTLTRITDAKSQLDRDALAPLTRHALHHAKQLEQKLHNMTGFGTLEDITDLVRLFTERRCIKTPITPQSPRADR